MCSRSKLLMVHLLLSEVMELSSPGVTMVATAEKGTCLIDSVLGNHGFFCCTFKNTGSIQFLLFKKCRACLKSFGHLNLRESGSHLN